MASSASCVKLSNLEILLVFYTYMYIIVDTKDQDGSADLEEKLKINPVHEIKVGYYYGYCVNSV